jgi:aquaporin Z
MVRYAELRGKRPSDYRINDDAQSLSPLPEGEGQGEGEPSAKPLRLLHSAIIAFRKHWPEYLCEAACLGTFMISAGMFTALLEYPSSPVRQVLPNDFVRLALNGLTMGLTAIAIIYSPWGARSGAHMNPAVTWIFFRLGKVKPWDALFYPIFQTLGGIAGVLLVKFALGRIFTEAPVNYVVTVPGKAGTATALIAETLIACGMMLMVLFMTNSPKLARFTGLCGGTLVFLYITFEAPLSGMSINPARTVASALPSGVWTAGWIYFVAPIGGMLLAVEIYRALRKGAQVACAKWNHDPSQRCIFCGHPGAKLR